MWDPAAERLARNFQVLRFDLPGFGESPAGGDVSTMDGMAAEVWSSLDALGIAEPVVPVGLSMGGYVLFRMFAKAPERIRAAALISTRAAPDTPEAREKRFKTIGLVEGSGTEALAGVMAGALLGKDSLDGNPGLVRRVTEWIVAASPRGVTAALRGMAERPDSTPLLGRMGVPALVLAGNQDTVVSPPEMKAMADALPRSRFETLEGAGHLLNLEKPEQFIETFLHFLKRSVL